MISYSGSVEQAIILVFELLLMPDPVLCFGFLIREITGEIAIGRPQWSIGLFYD